MARSLKLKLKEEEKLIPVKFSLEEEKNKDLKLLSTLTKTPIKEMMLMAVDKILEVNKDIILEAKNKEEKKTKKKNLDPKLGGEESDINNIKVEGSNEDDLTLIKGEYKPKEDDNEIAK